MIRCEGCGEVLRYLRVRLVDERLFKYETHDVGHAVEHAYHQSRDIQTVRTPNVPPYTSWVRHIALMCPWCSHDVKNDGFLLNDPHIQMNIQLMTFGTSDWTVRIGHRETDP